MNKKKVIIAHVPYQYRGGEDIFVDALFKAYEDIGYQCVFYPVNRKAPDNQLKYALQSLAPGTHDDFRDFYEATGTALVHLNNAYPKLGPSFFRYCIKHDVPLVMTVHNHRFFCTNGLALKDGRICKACFEDRAEKSVAVRPLIHNCNHDLKKSAYYSLAMSQLNGADLLRRAVKKFLCPSPYIADELIRWGVDRKRVEHVLNPIEWKFDEKKVKAKKIKEADVFYAGRLSQEKGIDLLLELVERAPEIRFVIAGDGPERKKVIEVMETCHNLTYYSDLSHDEVLAQIEKSHIGVLLSVCNEVLPTFVLECFAHGKRCLVPDLDSTYWFDEGKGEWLGVLADTTSSDATLERLRKTLSRFNTDPVSSEKIEKIRGRISTDTFKAALSRAVNDIGVKSTDVSSH